MNVYVLTCTVRVEHAPFDRNDLVGVYATWDAAESARAERGVAGKIVRWTVEGYQDETLSAMEPQSEYGESFTTRATRRDPSNPLH